MVEKIHRYLTHTKSYLNSLYLGDQKKVGAQGARYDQKIGRRAIRQFLEGILYEYQVGSNGGSIQQNSIGQDPAIPGILLKAINENKT